MSDELAKKFGLPHVQRREWSENEKWLRKTIEISMLVSGLPYSSCIAVLSIVLGKVAVLAEAQGIAPVVIDSCVTANRIAGEEDQRIFMEQKGKAQ